MISNSFNHVLLSASKSIEDSLGRNDMVLNSVLELFYNCKGKLVFSGIGKSSIIAQKMAATFSSTGTSSVFLHAGEALHGDLGICREGDVAIVISKSGTTAELLAIIPSLLSFGIPVIGILGNINSPIAKLCNFVLDASVTKEADLYNIVPSSSTTLAITIGDALAISLMELKGFTDKDFVKFHPGGQLGKDLSHLK
jgi:arabinose-5-phosphate isomerase